MGKAPRAAGVLRAVAELAGWNGPGPVERPRARRRGGRELRQLSSRRSPRSRVGEDGEPRVHKVWCAVDCGVAVNPDVIRAQMEGGIGYGLGHVLFAEVTLDEGRPVQAQLRQLPLAAHPRDAGGRGRASCRRPRSRPASASPACRRSGRRSPTRWRGSGSGGRGGCRSSRGGGVMRTLASGGRVAGAIVAARGARCQRRQTAAAAALATDAAAGLGASRRSPITRARSVALFEEAGKVMQHPRCVNCHPRGDRPTAERRDAAARAAGGARRGRPRRAGAALHAPAIATRISIRRACPAIRNGTSRRRRWPGRASRSARSASRSRIRRATAARTSPRIVKHSTERQLVGWGWNPGAGRTPAPGTQAEFGALMQGLGRYRRALSGSDGRTYDGVAAVSDTNPCRGLSGVRSRSGPERHQIGARPAGLALDPAVFDQSSRRPRSGGFLPSRRTKTLSARIVSRRSDPSA